jgi:hypothetical protein
MFVIPRLSNVIGAEKEPMMNSLFDFSVKLEVNSKLPCVNPPPSTSWNPTRLSENVLLAVAF